MRRSFARPIAIGLGVLAAVAVADRLSKFWILEILDLPARRSIEITPFFNLTMVWNKGVSFGLFAADNGSWGQIGLVVFALIVVAALAIWLVRSDTLLVATALGLVIGGALGNVYDRIRFGAVADFLDFHAFGYHWYVFNIADAAITCGVALLLLDGLLAGRHRPK